MSNLIQIDEIKCLEYKLFTTGLQSEFGINSIKITFPKELILQDDFLEIMCEVEKYIKKLDEKNALNLLNSHLCKKAKNNKILQNLLSQALKELIKFEEKELNSIWLRIFSNYFKVAIFDKFDYIVINPPWMQWSVLPKNYRKNTKENIRLDRLFWTIKMLAEIT